MSYQVLARKWRPQNFKQMVGQEHVLRALIHALESQRLHHAYLFTGTRGVGKTTIGRILAKCLSCHKGITAEPCGTCGACTSIVEGRYVDLIEIDAASRTKVEDMRELLDNVQYAPTEGRFKIYLIDEVHMLSQSSFNALLKTLEEPPEHVKFLFATTDPQKLPVTILSRCLQFNLKNMSPERIVGHLQHILSEEKVSAEDPALWSIARAADGSMRDALSLTDQAIAYGNSVLSESGVSAMLGTIDQKRVYRILAALVANNAKLLLDEVASLAEFSPDYQSVLASLISILHRIAVEQAVPGATDNTMGDQTEVCTYAKSMSAEDLQLFYQIALVSRSDLKMHPDPRAGLEMALIRMLAFQLDQPPAVQGELSNSGGVEPAEASNPAGFDDEASVESNRDLTNESAAIDSVTEERAPETVSHDPALDESISESVSIAPSVLTAESAAVIEQDSMPEAPPIESYENIPDSDYSESEASVAQAYESAASGVDSSQDVLSKKKTELAEQNETLGPVGHEPAISALGNVEASAVKSAVAINDQTPHDAKSQLDGDIATVGANASPEAVSIESDSWPVQSMQIGVSGMTQNLLFNMSLLEQDDATVLYVETGHYRLLNSNHEKRIVEAVQAFLDNAKPVKFVDGLLAGQETPMMWRERRAAEMLQKAKDEVGRDPNVQQLIEAFDAFVVDGSIKALGELV